MYRARSSHSSAVFSMAAGGCSDPAKLFAVSCQKQCCVPGPRLAIPRPQEQHTALDNSTNIYYLVNSCAGKTLFARTVFSESPKSECTAPGTGAGGGLCGWPLEAARALEAARGHCCCAAVRTRCLWSCSTQPLSCGKAQRRLGAS